MEPESPNSKYLQLAEKWMNGTITPEEEQEFAEWYNKDQIKEIVVPHSFVSGEEEHSRRILQQIRQMRAMEEPAAASATLPVRRLVRARMRMAAAAVLLIVASAAAWLFYGRSSVGQPPAGTVTAGSQTIRPLGNRATLTLGNGSVVDLDVAKEVPAIAGSKVAINKQKAELVYTASATPELVYNTLTTPRGGMYSVILSDGTQVWLNASSSLRYPTTFKGPNRSVSLTGEGYFEVAKNQAQPFQVLVNGMKVNVLGTHFNILAYDDEPAIATTLLEGAVKVGYMGSSTDLVPGQQSFLVRGNKEVRVRNVDVEETVAWKNGIFQFRSEDIKSVMRKVARWYDVDVRYEGEINDHFSGAVYRDADVSSLLRTIELTHKVHFHIEGRTITVSP